MPPVLPFFYDGQYPIRNPADGDVRDVYVIESFHMHSISPVVMLFANIESIFSSISP